MALSPGRDTPRDLLPVGPRKELGGETREDLVNKSYWPMLKPIGKGNSRLARSDWLGGRKKPPLLLTRELGYGVLELLGFGSRAPEATGERGWGCEAGWREVRGRDPERPRTGLPASQAQSPQL